MFRRRLLLYPRLVTSAPLLLLDTYTGAAAAYSLRKLRTAYTGAAIRVRESGGNTELDIGFVGQDLDTAALLAHCGANSGYVVTWYDQSGNAYNATQATSTAQPRIVNAGSLETEDGKLTLSFDGTDDKLVPSSSSDIFRNQQYGTMFAVCRDTNHTNGVNHSVYYISTSASSTRFALFTRVSSFGYFSAGGRRLDGDSFVYSGIASSNSRVLLTGLAKWAENSLVISVNGTAGTPIAYSSGAGSTSNTASNVVVIGGDNTYVYYGKISEIAIYPIDQSANKVAIESNINSYWEVYGPYANSWDGTQTSLLDTYTGSAAAYSLRALNSQYTGPLIRVRRSSDNAEADVYALANGDLDTTRLLAFVGAGSGYVVTWYDQSGNARNATQATSTAQPRIVNAGVLETQGGRASVKFDGTDDLLSGSLGINATTPNSWFGVGSMSSVSNGTKGMGGLGFNTYNSSGGVCFNFGQIAGGNNTVGTSSIRNNPTEVLGSVSSSLSINTPYLFGWLFESSQVSGYVNGSIIGSDPTSISSIADTSGGNIYLGRGRYSFNRWQGGVKEQIFFLSNQSANRTGIEANINAYWGIY